MQEQADCRLTRISDFKAVTELGKGWDDGDVLNLSLAYRGLPPCLHPGFVGLDPRFGFVHVLEQNGRLRQGAGQSLQGLDGICDCSFVAG